MQHNKSKKKIYEILGNILLTLFIIGGFVFFFYGNNQEVNLYNDNVDEFKRISESHENFYNTYKSCGFSGDPALLLHKNTECLSATINILSYDYDKETLRKIIKDYNEVLYRKKGS